MLVVCIHLYLPPLYPPPVSITIASSSIRPGSRIQDPGFRIHDQICCGKTASISLVRAVEGNGGGSFPSHEEDTRLREPNLCFLKLDLGHIELAYILVEEQG